MKKPTTADSQAAGAAAEMQPRGPAPSSKVLIESAKRAGAKAVVAIMWEFPRRGGVQWRGCNALKDLAFDGGTHTCEQTRFASMLRLGQPTDGARVEIAISGGIQAIMHALQVFPSDAIVQHHGCLAIMNVAFNSGRWGWLHFVFSQLSLTCCLCCSEPNRAQFVAAGAVQLVLEALRTCPDDHGVQASACGALANLAQNGTHGTRLSELLRRSPGTVHTHTDDARAIVVVKGGIPLIVAALSKFPTRHRVVQRACWALLSLTARNGTVHCPVWR